MCVGAVVQLDRVRRKQLCYDGKTARCDRGPKATDHPNHGLEASLVAFALNVQLPEAHVDQVQPIGAGLVEGAGNVGLLLLVLEAGDALVQLAQTLTDDLLTLVQQADAIDSLDHLRHQALHFANVAVEAVELLVRNGLFVLLRAHVNLSDLAHWPY